MADGQCDYGDTPHGRNHILTTITPPLTLELCDEHEAPGLIFILADRLGVDGERFYAMITRWLDKEAKAADKALADARAAEASQGSKGPPAPDDGGHQGDDDAGMAGAALPMDNGSRAVTGP